MGVTRRSCSLTRRPRWMPGLSFPVGGACCSYWGLPVGGTSSSNWGFPVGGTCYSSDPLGPIRLSRRRRLLQQLGLTRRRHQYFQVPNNRRAQIIDSMQEFGLIANRLDPNKSSDAIFLNYPKRCDANLIDTMKIS